MRTVMRRNGILVSALLGSMLALPLSGCSPDKVLGSNTLPPDVPDPAHVQTPAGALAIYRGAAVQFGQAFGGQHGVVRATALLTDELQDGHVGIVGAGVSGGWPNVDARLLSGLAGYLTDDVYSVSQKTRGQINQALGALRTYAPDAPVALQGQLYTLEGYTETFLADLFCSGVPLSTLDFNGDYTYEPGSTTQAIYEQAAAHFDSALAVATDSADVMNLARLGKARALLSLGEYAAAGQVVADVPDGFRYAISYPGDDQNNSNFARAIWTVNNGTATMTDREGGNGLPYLSSRDPRTPSVSIGTNSHGVSLYRPAQYAANGGNPVVLASGVEARLIEAEAQLHAGEATWLATLNALRTDGTYDTRTNAQDSTKTDTLWHAGTGGVAGLAPLEDPGTVDSRVNLLFQERGYWLFLTGHRQGDLRRLVRAYVRDPETVYPTGSYAGLTGRYGSDVNAPVPQEEELYNPRFHGCLNRGA